MTYNYAAAGSNNGQIASVTDNADSGRTVSYTYDNLARLASAVTNGDTSYPKWGLSFSYDRYGNRTAQTVTAGSAPSNSVTIDQTTNRITGSPYAYDANGNMTNDGLNSMVYDAENRVTSAAGAAYSYDGKSLRVKRVAGRTTTVYIYSGTKVIAEYENGAAPSAPTREYIYSGAALLAKIESGAVQYYHADHLSVRLMTDSAGNVIGQQAHYPFGESWYQTNTTTKWLFTSYERDSESGNDYATFRYNVNRLGRFASPDLLAGSVSDPQSLNRYAYVLNDAVNLVDPLGLDPEWGCFEGSANWPSCQFSSGGEGEGGAGADIAVVPAPLSGPGCTWDTITLTIHCPDPDPVAEGDPYFYYCAAYGWCGPPADPGAHDLAGQGGGGGGAQGPAQLQKPQTPAQAATQYCQEHGQLSFNIPFTHIPVTISLSTTLLVLNYSTTSDLAAVLPWTLGASLDFSVDAPQSPQALVSVGAGRNLSGGTFLTPKGPRGLELSVGPSAGSPVTVSLPAGNACGLAAGGAQ